MFSGKNVTNGEGLLVDSLGRISSQFFRPHNVKVRGWRGEAGWKGWGMERDGEVAEKGG